MSKYYGNTDFNGSRGVSKPRMKRSWKIFLIVAGCIIGLAVVLTGCFFWVVGVYLRPERITRLIEEKSGEFIDGEVKIGKLDYKLFSTYPWLEFEVDSLYVISHTLKGLSPSEKAQLPSESDLLASIVKLQGKVNVGALMHSKIKLKDIYIVNPEVNIVIANDSVNNFSIAKNLHSAKKVPEIDISEIKVDAPVDLKYFSLPQDTQAHLDVEDFYFVKDEDGDINLSFSGFAEGHYQNFETPGTLPIKFNTKVRFLYPDVSVALKNLSLSLAGLRFDADGDILASSEKIDIKNAGFSVSVDDIFTLLRYLPESLYQQIKLPEGIMGNLPLKLTVLLDNPYSVNLKENREFSLQSLPALRGVLKVEDANLFLKPPKGKKIEADDIYLEVEYNFDPEISDSTNIVVKELRMHGEGIALTADARINNLTGETQSFEGNLDIASPLVESLAYFIPNLGMNIAGMLKGRIEFSGDALNLGKDGLQHLVLSGDLVTRALNVKSKAVGNLKMKNMKTDFQAMVPSYPLKDYSGTKLGFDFSTDSVTFLNGGEKVSLAGLVMNLDAMDTVHGSPDPFGNLLVKLKSLEAGFSGSKLRAENIDLKAKGTLNSTPPSYASAPSYSNGQDDALVASRVAHTPLTLEYEGGGIMQTLISLLQLDAVVNTVNIRFDFPQYLYPVLLSGINLSSDLNNLAFSADKVKIARTGFSLTGEMSGLAPFLTSYSATPLKASADINFDNVDINQLSWGYYGELIRQGNDSALVSPPMGPYTAADSVCIAIPRNIDARLRLHSDKAEYMQYSFSPLSTDIIVKDGVATLSKLTVGAPYCTAVVDWTYSTRNLDNVFMDLKAKVEDFSFSKFYTVFPSLIEKSPELKNFTGYLNSDIGCYFGMFPDMFMDSESLRGRFDINASGMEFARQGKIERITHLMLIEGDQPIHIQNINIRGSFHDNLLEINPFKIAFDDYRLEFGGINNIAGDMYYHLALEQSPFHLPFGVTLKGKFKHPEVRLGGTRMDDYKAEMLEEDKNPRINVNIMTWLRHGWELFIKEAAKFEEENP